MQVKDPLIELLAIKLYEHDSADGWFPPRDGWRITSWSHCLEEDREIYRSIARGQDTYGKEEEDAS